MRMDDKGTSPVVGILMIIAIAMPTVLALGMYLDSFEANLEAQRRASEKAAWCAEHPNQEWPGPGECPDPGPRGWDCVPGQTNADTLKCVPRDADADPDDYLLIKCDEGELKDQDGTHWREC